MNEIWKAHKTYALSQIENFQENPLEYHAEPSLNAPLDSQLVSMNKTFVAQNDSLIRID